MSYSCHEGLFLVSLSEDKKELDQAFLVERQPREKRRVSLSFLVKYRLSLNVQTSPLHTYFLELAGSEKQLKTLKNEAMFAI